MSSSNACGRIGKYLCANKHLEYLGIGDSRLTDKRMRKLFQDSAQQNITNEYLAKCNVIERIFQKIGVNEVVLINRVSESLNSWSFPNLVCLCISCGNEFGAGGLDLLVKSLSGCPIKELIINECKISGLSPLRGLVKCKMLTRLNLRGTVLGVADANTIAFLLGNEYPKLRYLKLISCGITDDMIEVISRGLLKSTTIEDVHLEGNEIGDRGLALKKVVDTSTFEACMQSNHSIYKIILSFDVIVCEINMFHRYKRLNEKAVIKYVKHLAKRNNADLRNESSS